jgi:hypothetical protein
MGTPKVLLLIVCTLALALPAYAQGGAGGGSSGGGAAAAGGTASSPSSTGGSASRNPAAIEKSQPQKNRTEQAEKKAAVSGSKTQRTPAGSGTVSAPGVGVGHAVNGKPIGMPGSGLGSRGNSTGPTK